MEKITTIEQYFEVLSRIDVIFHAKKNTPEAIEMLKLLDLIQDFEDNTDFIPENPYILSRNNF